MRKPTRDDFTTKREEQVSSLKMISGGRVRVRVSVKEITLWKEYAEKLEQYIKYKEL